MVLQERLYTNAEFWEIAARPENATKRLELVNGVIREKGNSDDMASSGRLNTVVAGRVLHYLNAFVIPRDLGYDTGADSGFDLAPGLARQPDTAFIAKARVKTLDGTAFDGAPDLAVEVVSPSESSRDVIDKARLYLTHGGRLVWTVYPLAQVVDVYRLNEGGSLVIDTLDVNGLLTGGDVLPGFSLAVSAIFPA